MLALHCDKRAAAPTAQLVRVDKPDDGRSGASDGTILQVSYAPEGQHPEDTGRSAASVQFMITRAMRAQLASAGYSSTEVDTMDPTRAASIIAQAKGGVRSSRKGAQSKQKRKRDRFQIQFTCNVCEGANSHSVSWHAYRKGVVIATCPHCQSTHLIADNLNWIDDDFKNLEEYMSKHGTPPVKNLLTNGVAVTLEDEAGTEPASAHAGSSRARTEPAIRPLDGISEDQARRIREAVRKNKKARVRGDDGESGRP